MSYTVLFSMECPDETDDFLGGEDYATKEEALDAFNATPTGYYRNAPWIALDGPDVWLVRKNNAAQGHDDCWKREQAHQAGMELGCVGWNDYYG